MRMATQIMKEAMKNPRKAIMKVMMEKVVMLVLLLSMKKMRISRAQKNPSLSFLCF